MLNSSRKAARKAAEAAYRLAAPREEPGQLTAGDLAAIAGLPNPGHSALEYSPKDFNIPERQ